MYGFPGREAAEVAAGAVREVLSGDVDGEEWGDGEDKGKQGGEGGRGRGDGEGEIGTAKKAFDRIVFCVFMERDEEIYKEILPYVDSI